MACATASGRTPLMAGNWKMNLNHLEAIHLVQKLALTLRTPSRLEAVEVVVLPPFTDLRTVQTLVDGDKPDSATARRTSPRTPGRLHRRGLAARCWPSSAAPTSWSATRERRQYHDEDDAL